jgi:hypothetical protein
MRRPIPAAVVLDALPAACEVDREACQQVRRYLRNYMSTWGLTGLEVQGAVSSDDSAAVLPNSHGELVDSPWRVSASGYFQPNDYIIVNAGGVAYDGEATPTGSFVSVGFSYAQLDIGFRDHWLSPLSDSTSLMGTEAPTMPSITLSNYDPISPLGISYEVFAAEMSRQEGIQYKDTTTSGKPRIAGLQLAAEPVRGYGVAVNRVTQYGGGARGGGGFSDFFDALVTSSNDADVAGSTDATNRIASLTSSIQFPGAVPFSVSIEYAGEDNAYAGRYRLGATNFSVSLDFPVLWNAFDATLEMSEWQNDWYVHFLYPAGFTNDGRVVGHWFGDNRSFGDAIGGDSQMLRVGWQTGWGDYVQATYRTMVLRPEWAIDDAPRAYDRLHMLGIGYTTSWREHVIAAELLVGRDVFGESFTRLSASFDLARTRARAAPVSGSSADRGGGTEVFVDVGTAASSVRKILGVDIPNESTDWKMSGHIGIGARRPVSFNSDLGVRIEFDRADGYDLISVRALDYRYRMGRKLAAGLFVGAARYDIGLPAYGYYWGVGFQFRDLLPKWDLGLDLRHHEKLGRDKTLPTDPPSTPDRTRVFYDVDSIALHVSRRW